MFNAEGYKLLIHELMWSQHLFRYQEVMLNREELESLGIATSGRVRSLVNRALEIELESEQMG